jgi:hypothetical protein
VTRALEYVAAALDEAEAAARWYAERSATSARQFSEELDAACLRGRHWLCSEWLRSIPTSSLMRCTASVVLPNRRLQPAAPGVITRRPG